MLQTAKTLQIDRRTGLTHQEFVSEYRNPGKPVIFTDLSKNWPAAAKFTPEYFEDNFGDREIEIGGKIYTLTKLFDLLKNSTKENPAPYPFKLNVRKDFADLEPDVSPRPSIAKPDRTHSSLIPKMLLDNLYDLEIFFGGPGGEFPYLHYDFLGLYAYINQIYGEKEFTIFSPDQQKYLYPKPDAPWLSEIENHHNPDLKKYPLFAEATPTKIIISAGETLFIPCGWYHTARSLTLTISVAFDQLCESNWEFFTNECCIPRGKNSLKAKMIKAYLKSADAVLSAREKLMGTD
ncbi:MULTISPECIES: cupin-like domain-containing protein [unclassified Microcoleus]|uniref:cupin-like domain-containing protein n=1 Tax=unclassified Microcoleus TaxID=2642155 RepID=UPI002FD630E4